MVPSPAVSHAMIARRIIATCHLCARALHRLARVAYVVQRRNKLLLFAAWGASTLLRVPASSSPLPAAPTRRQAESALRLLRVESHLTQPEYTRWFAQKKIGLFEVGARHFFCCTYAMLTSQQICDELQAFERKLARERKARARQQAIEEAPLLPNATSSAARTYCLNWNSRALKSMMLAMRDMCEDICAHAAHCTGRDACGKDGSIRQRTTS